MEDFIKEEFYIDPETGEVVEINEQGIILQTHEEKQKTKEYFESLKKKEKINQTYKEYGNFVWHIYTTLQETFPSLKPSNVTRLMFMATFTGYDGELKFRSDRPINRTQIFSLLGISEREFRNFWNELKSCDLIREEEDKIILNKDIFKKGKLSPKEIAKLAAKDKHITRLYIQGIRKLYIKATPRSHKNLSYIFKILPFVNREYNIVCHNPLETELDEVNAMTLGEFCNIIGYSEKNITQLFNSLFSVTFKIRGKETSAIRYVADKSINKKTYKMFINPNVYYAGSHWDKVEVLGKF